MAKRDFLLTFEDWQKIFPEKRDLKWENDWLENDYCRDCRLCCGPQGDDEPFPMALTDAQIGPSNRRDFYMRDDSTALLGRAGCKSLEPGGCRLNKGARPLACGLFPLVLANGRLFLYKRCPAALFASPAEIESLTARAAEFLRGLPERDLRRISINLSDAVVAEKYEDLKISLFEN